MTKSLDPIRIRGARQHNLKNVSLELPRDRLIVVTGLSGSGKSSLAFDTLYAEGQRRYVESLSAYARQFLEQMEKPDVDSIEGLSPAIAIEQKGLARSPRSTVGTVTEIYDFVRLLYARVGEAHCFRCGKPISSQTIPEIVDRLMQLGEGTRIVVLAPIARGRKGEFRRELQELRRAGFVRVRVDGELVDLESEIPLAKNRSHTIEVVVDRLVIKPGVEKRLADSVEVALRYGSEVCRVDVDRGGTVEEVVFSRRLACPDCGVSYAELSPRLFSFNSPHGACPTCKGLGEIPFFDPQRIVPDDTRTLRRGAIAPWGRAPSAYHVDLLAALGRALGFDLDTPFRDLPEATRRAILSGTGEQAVDFVHEKGGRTFTVSRPFPGVIGLLERRARDDGPEAARERFSEYLSAHPCATCNGTRLRREAEWVFVGGKNVVAMSRMPADELLPFIEGLDLGPQRREIARRLVAEIGSRLRFLLEVGLGYLTLDRAAATLSGGEGQRLRLATQVGSGLVGVLYILDEPSVGLHPRDHAKLLEILKRLRDLGNTVVVVEHDRETILAADHVVDMGPGAGESGGRVIAEGSPAEIERAPESLTGAYLSGRKLVPLPRVRRTGGGWSLKLTGARANNLKAIDVEIPLGTITCVTGVSGSGKSSLVIDTLVPAVAEKLRQGRARPGSFDAIEGWQLLDKVIVMDQSPIGRTPRSNPATYTGLFAPIRELFSQTPDARLRGWGPGRFSFNVKGGRCEACAGEGLIRIEMHFLPDVFVVCEQCGGTRYARDTLEVRYKGRSIAEVLDTSVAEAREFFAAVPPIAEKLATLEDVGVGYVRLGQPANTLSGGEAQRIKLARELSRRATGRTLYVLDEPTTGLHFADVDCLLRVLSRLADGGNTVLIIEHNLDVVKVADHVIDLGPEGGAAGGEVVASGTPEEIAASPRSHTGRWLAPVLRAAGNIDVDSPERERDTGQEASST
ncbi:MAG: excinuclease subunit [Candidatus Binatota bacterium]|nr:excinuclease subunit [Candidatus Binatota bacterium]